MSEVEHVTALPETAITVDTVSVPVVTVGTHAALVADLRPVAPLGEGSDVTTTARPSDWHVGSQVYSPVWPRMRSGWRSLTLMWVGAVTGIAAVVIALTAWVWWLI